MKIVYADTPVFENISRHDAECIFCAVCADAVDFFSRLDAPTGSGFSDDIKGVLTGFNACGNAVSDNAQVQAFLDAYTGFWADTDVVRLIHDSPAQVAGVGWLVLDRLRFLADMFGGMFDGAFCPARKVLEELCARIRQYGNRKRF